MVFSATTSEQLEHHTDTLVPEYQEDPEKPGFGRLITVEDQVLVVFKESSNNLAFHINLNRFSKGSSPIKINHDIQKIKFPIVGMFKLHDNCSYQLGIFIASGKSYFLKDSIQYNGRESSIMSQCSYFDVTARFPKQDQKIMADFVINGFHEFKLDRSSGIIRSGLEFETAYLDDLIGNMVNQMIVSKSGNLSTVRAVNHPDQRGTKSLVRFDIQLRIDTVNKFIKFLKMNKLFDQLSQRGKSSILEALEKLTAAATLREKEEKNPVASIFQNNLFQSLEVYEKPRLVIEALEGIIENQDLYGGDQLPLVNDLFCSILYDVQNVRKTTLKEFQIDTVSHPWWIHSESFIENQLFTKLFLSVREFSKKGIQP